MRSSLTHKLATIILTSLVLIGCSGETTQSVGLYAENDDARLEILQSCIDYSGVVEDTPNCQNAFEAEMQT